MIYIYWK
jgi:hypothetical protein